MATLGEQRVRLDFNPNGDTMVGDIKEQVARLIDIMEDLKQEGKDGWTCVVAQTELETACMWAVKAATS